MAAFDYYDLTYPVGQRVIDLVPTSAGNHTYIAPAPYNDDLAIEVPGPTGDPGSCYIYFNSAVVTDYTLELNVYIDKLPIDFTDVVNSHIFFGAINATGYCAGIFLSQVGIMYAGSIYHDVSDGMHIGSATQLIPGSSEYVTTGEMLNIRIAVSAEIGAVYIFVSKKDDPVVYVLRAVMPPVDSESLSFSPVDRSIVSVSGTYASPSLMYLDRIQMVDAVLIPDLLPVADAGDDQAVRTCSIVELDGSGSFDPEGAPLTYQWYLTDAPIGSENALEASDGNIVAANEIRSAELGPFHAADPILPGDVIQLNGDARVIDTVAVIVGEVALTVLPAYADMTFPATVVAFKVLRQRGVKDATTQKPTFYPDLPGFYAFELVVYDGANYSLPANVIVNVLESPLPRGCTPDLSFIFSYLGDFWRLVEDKEPIATFWSALAQVTATELYTLWQVDYSKSLRDIQRQFIRRWLHYDLLLAEPIPELTAVRGVWGGVSSSLIVNPGVAASATTLVLSFLGQTVTHTFTGGDPFTYTDLYNELVLAFARYGFVIHSFYDRTTGPAPFDGYVRIYAPFPFTVESTSTLSPTVISQGPSSHPQGTGAGVASRVYQVDTSLEGLDIQADDLLVLEGVGYRIQELRDVDTDPLPSQRLVLKDALPVTASASWEIGGSVKSELLDFYSGMATRDDPVFLEVTSLDYDLVPDQRENTLVRTTVLGVCEALPGTVAIAPTPVGDYLYQSDDYAVKLAKLLRRSYIPRSSLIEDIPHLGAEIVVTDDTAVLRRNLDYFLETYRGGDCIRFVAGYNGGPDIWEGEDPPERLWAEYSYLDNRPRVESNFGIPVGFTLDDLSELPSGVDYLSAVRGLWYSYTHPPTLYNLRVGVQILLGLPFAEQAGTIEEIRTDFSPNEGRILIRDTENDAIVRSYHFPRSLEMEVDFTTGERWAVGDVVPQFAPLVTGAEVLDYIKDPEWFASLISQGSFYEVEKYFRFILRVDSTVFNLASLIFAHEFVLKVKPTYTYPLLTVLLRADEVEIDVTDETALHVDLILADMGCDGSTWMGIATTWDDMRAAGGGCRNRYDAGPDPAIPPPSPPILWGYDKAYLCPEDPIYATLAVTFAVPTVATFDSVFAWDVKPTTAYTFSIPATCHTERPIRRRYHRCSCAGLWGNPCSGWVRDCGDRERCS